VTLSGAGKTESMKPDQLIPLTMAADLLVSRLGKKPSRRTLRRWATEGRDGHKIRVIRLGPTWWTRPAWVAEFIRDLAATRPTASAGTKRARVSRALEKLNQMGIKTETSRPG
jgi:hypothetical protein